MMPVFIYFGFHHAHPYPLLHATEITMITFRKHHTLTIKSHYPLSKYVLPLTYRHYWQRRQMNHKRYTYTSL